MRNWTAGFTIICLLSPSWIDVEPLFSSRAFVVWNVGQGAWSTYVTENRCFHFDMGVDFAPWKKIRRQCQTKTNELFFSHWDWDHIRFVQMATRLLSSPCVSARPAGVGAPWKRKKFESLQNCGAFSGVAKEVHFSSSPSRIQTPSQRRARRTANEVSRIFTVQTRFLLPGDSTSQAEKKWAQNVRGSTRVLVLGHHGSKTSTSEHLLGQLTGLRQAVASAQQKKYGHPHRVVVERLRLHGIALLKTEDWGSIHFLESPARRVSSTPSGQPGRESRGSTTQGGIGCLQNRG